MDLLSASVFPGYGQGGYVCAHGGAAAVVAAIALAVLAAAFYALKSAPSFNPVELCGPKDKTL